MPCGELVAGRSVASFLTDPTSRKGKVLEVEEMQREMVRNQ